jgi:hypothetical protein
MMLPLLCIVLALLLVSLAFTDGWLMVATYSVLSVSTAMMIFLTALNR